MLSQQVKAQSPKCIIDMDKPNWGENVVGTALGQFDAAQLCHNHYHRSSNLSFCCGMAEFPVTKEGGAGKKDLFNLTNEIYYAFLNCGFKLSATGGSAMGVMPLPLGYNRTYTKLTKPLTEMNYLQAIRQGRTFATSGPMLFIAANGKTCGDTIDCSIEKNVSVLIKVELRSIQSIDKLELIHNGKVIKKISLQKKNPDPVLLENFSFKLKPLRSGWIATRALFRETKKFLRQSHTSPIYIRVDEKPIAFKKDADFMIEWIKRIIKVNRKKERYASEEQRNQVETIFYKAQGIYESIRENAIYYWGD
jgi:hypothetical protein